MTDKERRNIPGTLLAAAERVHRDAHSDLNREGAKHVFGKDPSEEQLEFHHRMRAFRNDLPHPAVAEGTRECEQTDLHSGI